MIEQFIKTYGPISDGLVTKVLFESSSNEDDIYSKGKVVITMHAMNVLNGHSWECLEVTLKDVLRFRFVENEKTCSVVINEALIQAQNDRTIVDFFPLRWGHELSEDPNSDFSVHFKRLSFRVLPENKAK